MPTAPFNIIVVPFTVYTAPAGEAAPEISATPAGNWSVLGANGDKDLDEEGITITHEQTVEVFRGLGSTGPRKAFRTEENLMIGFTLADVSPAHYAKVLNDSAVTSVAAGSGTGGYDKFDLAQGPVVNNIAILVKGDDSPLATSTSDDFKSQLWVPYAFNQGNPEVVITKSDVMKLACEFSALDDPTDGFGEWQFQDAAPS